MLSALLLVVLAYGLYWLHRFLDSSPWGNQSFDQEEWKSRVRDMSPWSPRGEMLHDLLENHLVPGMTRDQVVQLLGRPNLGELPPERSYRLGMWSGMHMDYDALVVRFTEDGVVERAYRIQG